MTPKSPNRGLYLHIPFCHARCGYCDFVTFTGKEDRIDAYIANLCKELSLYSRTSLNTVFFGGGTPSLLEPQHVARILGHTRSVFDLDAKAEITLEANPESITAEKASGWRSAGVNRISVGLQAFDDRLLKASDRLHTSADFVKAFHALRQAGFDNLSVDLIYGLPTQTLEEWQETLEKTIAIGPEHLSLYALKVEEHTSFHAEGIRVQDDLQADMYEWARVSLQKAGYPQYEISNFAKPGYECQHNLVYWRQEEYIGAGCGAVGFMKGVRWENHKNLADYEKALSVRQRPQLSAEALSLENLRFERLMLGLRLREGLEWPEENLDWRNQRQDLLQRNLLEVTASGRWRIPEHAVAMTNQVLLPFLSPQS